MTAHSFFLFVLPLIILFVTALAVWNEGRRAR